MAIVVRIGTGLAMLYLSIRIRDTERLPVVLGALILAEIASSRRTESQEEIKLVPYCTVLRQVREFRRQEQAGPRTKAGTPDGKGLE